MNNEFIILIKRVNSNKLSFNAAKTQYTENDSNIKRMTNMSININETIIIWAYTEIQRISN